MQNIVQNLLSEKVICKKKQINLLTNDYIYSMDKTCLRFSIEMQHSLKNSEITSNKLIKINITTYSVNINK